MNTQFKASQKIRSKRVAWSKPKTNTAKKRNVDPTPLVPSFLVEGKQLEVIGPELLSCEIMIVPPSVNHYWIKGRNNTNRLSKRALHFIEVLKRFIPAINYHGRVKVIVEYSPPDNKIRDIDNILKPCLDALAKGQLIEDDNQVHELSVKKMPVVKGGKLFIQVEKI